MTIYLLNCTVNYILLIIIKLQIIICKDTTLERGHDILLYLQELREMNVDEQETQKYGKD